MEKNHRSTVGGCTESMLSSLPWNWMAFIQTQNRSDSQSLLLHLSSPLLRHPTNKCYNLALAIPLRLLVVAN